MTPRLTRLITLGLYGFAVIFFLGLLFSRLSTLLTLAGLNQQATTLGITIDDARQRLNVIIPLIFLAMVFLTINLLAFMVNFRPLQRIWPVAPILVVFYGLFQTVSAFLLGAFGLFLLIVPAFLLAGALGYFSFRLTEANRPASIPTARKPTADRRPPATRPRR